MIDVAKAFLWSRNTDFIFSKKRQLAIFVECLALKTNCMGFRDAELLLRWKMICLATNFSATLDTIRGMLIGLKLHVESGSPDFKIEVITADFPAFGN